MSNEKRKHCSSSRIFSFITGKRHGAYVYVNTQEMVGPDSKPPDRALKTSRTFEDWRVWSRERTSRSECVPARGSSACTCTSGELSSARYRGSLLQSQLTTRCNLPSLVSCSEIDRELAGIRESVHFLLATRESRWEIADAGGNHTASSPSRNCISIRDTCYLMKINCTWEYRAGDEVNVASVPPFWG